MYAVCNKIGSRPAGGVNYNLSTGIMGNKCL